ncbi:MAG: cytochrome b6-f complex subunit PetL [Limnothrix sp.]
MASAIVPFAAYILVFTGIALAAFIGLRSADII